MSRRKPATVVNNAIHRKVATLGILAAIGVAFAADKSTDAERSRAAQARAVSGPDRLAAQPASPIAISDRPFSKIDLDEPAEPVPALAAPIAVKPVTGGDRPSGAEPPVKGMPRPGLSMARNDATPSPQQIMALIAESRRASGSEGRGD